MGGRGSTGAGLGLNAPLRFGVLMENCGRARPTVQQQWQREGPGPDQTTEREKVEREGGTSSPEGAGL